MSIAALAGPARAFAALGAPPRLAIVAELAHGDLASGELGARLQLPTNLLAHHLRVLEQAGLVARHRSEGDGRRTYVRRTPACDRLLALPGVPRPVRVAFLCSRNSARSPLAESYWRTVSDVPAVSAGTHPAPRVHPGAVAAGRRHGLDLSGARTRLVADVLTGDELVVAVCDRAYEELPGQILHWSIPDPARKGDPGAFDAAYDDLARRIDQLSAALEPRQHSG